MTGDEARAWRVIAEHTIHTILPNVGKAVAPHTGGGLLLSISIAIARCCVSLGSSGVATI